MGLQKVILGLAALAGASQCSVIEKKVDKDIMLLFGDSWAYAQGEDVQHDGNNWIGSHGGGHEAFTRQQLFSNHLVEKLEWTAFGGPVWAKWLTGCNTEEGGRVLPADCPGGVELWPFSFKSANVIREFHALNGEALTINGPSWVMTLEEQVGQYLAYAEPHLGARFDKGRVLVSVVAGLNDVIGARDWDPASVGGWPALYAAIAAKIVQKALDPLRAAGYKTFMLWDLIPFDRSPGNSRREEPSPSRDMIDQFNDALRRAAAAWATRHEADGVRALVYPVNSFLNGILDNYKDYGIANTKNFCSVFRHRVDGPKALKSALLRKEHGCLDLEDYFWFDFIHAQYHIQELIAKDIKKFLKKELGNDVWEAKHLRT